MAKAKIKVSNPAELVDSLMESIRSRIYYLKVKYRKPSNSTDMQGPIDIEHSVITLTQQAKYVEIYYNEETVIALRKIIELSNKYIEEHNKILTPIFNTLTTYVKGWSELKEITKENMSYVSFTLQRTINALQKFIDELAPLMEKFDKENASDIMVDYARLSLYTYTTEFPYRRAYNALVKKSVMKFDQLKVFVMMDVQTLDKIIELINILEAGWEKCGDTEEFEQYRECQIFLINALHQYVNLIEQDIHLAEHFIEYGSKVINFKVYPVIRKK